MDTSNLDQTIAAFRQNFKGFYGRLSQTEKKLLCFMSEGYNYFTISKKLDIKRASVRALVMRLIKKIDVDTALVDKTMLVVSCYSMHYPNLIESKFLPVGSLKSNIKTWNANQNKRR